MSGFFGGGGGSATTDAGDLTSGVLAHERGGLEADVSAYSGLLKIASGSTSQATAGTDYQAVLTGLADIPGSDKLAEARGGLGSLTGLIKATSGTASAAVAGTDYYNPGGTDVALADGGTGASTAAEARTNLGVPEGLTTGQVDVFGTSATNTGFFSSCIGSGSTVSGNLATLLGFSATVTADNGCAIGYSADANGASSIAIGAYAAANVANTAVMGSGNAAINALYCGKGYSNSAPTAWGIYGTRGSGTNIAGGACVLAGGASTGNAAGGSAKLQTSAPGSSGTDVNNLVDRFEADTNGVCWIHPVTTAPTVGRSNQIGLFSHAGILKAILPNNSVVTLDYT